MNKIFLVACLAACPLGSWAQTLRLDHLDRLAGKATETVNVTLDASVLKLASGFLDLADDTDSAEVKKLISGVKAILIRSFEFKTPGQYTDADVEEIRGQLRDPEWKRIVQVRSKVDGDSDVYVRNVAGKIVGLAIITAEPKELTVVSIDGTLDLEGLRKLGGNFGIPKSIGKKPEKPEAK